jgi:hypothetical protein
MFAMIKRAVENLIFGLPYGEGNVYIASFAEMSFAVNIAGQKANALVPSFAESVLNCCQETQCRVPHEPLPRQLMVGPAPFPYQAVKLTDCTLISRATVV